MNMQYWLKMDTGPVEVSVAQIQHLMTVDNLSPDKRVFSVDGGVTWESYNEILEYEDEEEDVPPPKPRAPKIRKVYSQCGCGATLENTSDKIGRADVCPSCGNQYQIMEGDARSKVPLIVTAGVGALGLAIAGWFVFSGGF